MPEYLYAPVNGTFNMCPYPWEKYCVGYNGPDAYCSSTGENHTNIQLDSPMDIITGWAAPVYLYVSTGIQSVSVTHYGNACGCFCGPTLAVQVHLYTGTGQGGDYVGSIYIAHITSRHAEGNYDLTLQNNWPPYYMYLTSPLGYCAPPGGASGCENNNTCCSSAYHPHVEQAEASTGSEVQCPDTSVAGSTWLYRWGS
jgi:hypothetical protein